MPLSKTHKEKTRQKILDAAGTLFRQHGFDGVGIDKIMSIAGLTRGGFYAHFSSKAELFSKVLEIEPAFTRMLVERQGNNKAETQQGTIDVLATYLDPANIDYVSSTCPMVSLARDVDKGGDPAREALTTVTTDLMTLLKNSMDGAALDQRALLILALCVGGVTVARTSAEPELARKMLEACEAEAQRLVLSSAI